MKFTTTLLFFVLVAVALGTMSNSGGRAAMGGAGATGAPSEGQACNSCHSGGNFGANVTLKLFEQGTNNEVTGDYVPSTTYDVEVSIGTTNTPAGYGFQALALTLNDLNSVSTWANNLTANTRITNLGSNGRQYFEQSSIASSSAFRAQWTAPAAGAGAVRFYLVGNAVNGNGQSSGDQAVNGTVTFNELTTSTAEQSLAAAKVRVFPNPTTDFVTLEWQATTADGYTLQLFDGNGSRLQTQHYQGHSGENRYRLVVEDLPKGVYFLQLTDGTQQWTQRFVKW